MSHAGTVSLDVACSASCPKRNFQRCPCTRISQAVCPRVLVTVLRQRTLGCRMTGTMLESPAGCVLLRSIDCHSNRSVSVSSTYVNPDLSKVNLARSNVAPKFQRRENATKAMIIGLRNKISARSSRASKVDFYHSFASIYTPLQSLNASVQPNCKAARLTLYSAGFATHSRRSIN